MQSNNNSANRKLQVVPSEQDIIEGFIRWFKRKENITLKIVSRPDKESNNSKQQDKDCDFICSNIKSGEQTAIEVTTLWREEGAAKQDKTWLEWTEYAKVNFINLTIPGYCYIITPIDLAIKTTKTKEEFSLFLNEWIANLKLDESCDDIQYKKEFDGHEILCSFHYSLKNSEISFARMMPEKTQIEDFLKRNFSDMPDKLFKYKHQGLTTCICIYNTFWVAMTHHDSERYIIEALKTLNTEKRRAIDKVYILSGNPPLDCWVDEVNVLEKYF